MALLALDLARHPIIIGLCFELQAAVLTIDFRKADKVPLEKSMMATRAADKKIEQPLEGAKNNCADNKILKKRDRGRLHASYRGHHTTARVRDTIHDPFRAPKSLPTFSVGLLHDAISPLPDKPQNTSLPRF